MPHDRKTIISLGLLLPDKKNIAGFDIRSHLQKVGAYRESDHEHQNGSLVEPVFDAIGDVAEVYGRKIRDDRRKGTSEDCGTCKLTDLANALAGVGARSCGKLVGDLLANLTRDDIGPALKAADAAAL